MPKAEQFQKLPAPWDRIFSLGTRTFVWALLIGILYILRPFFLLIFLTFVFAYVQAHCVDGLAHRIKSRIIRVIFVFLIVLGLIAGTGYFIGPRMKDQADEFLANHPTYLKDVDTAIHKFSKRFPALQRLVEQGIGGPVSGPKKDGDKNGENKDQEESPDKKKGAGTGAQAPESRPQNTDPPEIVRKLLGEVLETDDLKNLFANLQKAVGVVWGVGSSFLLSLLFSFLIVLDLTKITRQIKGLTSTKIGFIYDEVADNIREFAKVVGRALEAQLFIAIANTILTGIGIFFMDLPPLAFLCTIVFFCSFIPVAGVFISSVPICLVALQQSGVGLLLIAIALILIIHFIEAYFLNPKIYGHHLRMNAVMVLIVLTIGGTLFGVWGLILGLPIVNYIFRHAIRRPERETVDDAAPSGGSP